MQKAFPQPSEAGVFSSPVLGGGREGSLQPRKVIGLRAPPPDLPRVQGRKKAHVARGTSGLWGSSSALVASRSHQAVELRQEVVQVLAVSRVGELGEDGAAEGGGEVGEGRRVEDRRHRQLDAERGVQAGEHLGGEQRVAAEVARSYRRGRPARLPAPRPTPPPPRARASVRGATYSSPLPGSRAPAVRAGRPCRWG